MSDDTARFVVCCLMTGHLALLWLAVITLKLKIERLERRS